MRTYFVRLTKSDFAAVGNTYTSAVIDLYDNSSYKNYSVTRGLYGLNSLANDTFTGLKLVNPTTTDTGTLSGGRYIDTSGRADVISWSFNPTLTTGLGPVSATMDVCTTDMINAAFPDEYTCSYDLTTADLIGQYGSPRYLRLRLDVTAPEGAVFDFEVLVRVEIDIPVMVPKYRTTQEMLDNFPEWMAMRELENPAAVGSSATPGSLGGKFLNAIAGEWVEEVTNKLTTMDLQFYITSSDLNEVAWVYRTEQVPGFVWSVTGNGTALARAADLEEFYAANSDHVMWWDEEEEIVYTSKLYTTLQINGVTFTQVVHHVWNTFDDIGLMVDLQRLHLESNDSYQKRILDVHINRLGSGMNAFKLALRRELNLWKYWSQATPHVLGATPAATPTSDFYGATPEILEMSDIEDDPIYIQPDGMPTQRFIDLVDKLAIDFPTTWGRFRWDKTFWDMGGEKHEGYGILPYRFDATPVSDVQPGIGDLNDLLLFRPDVITGPRDFNVRLRARGRQKTTRTEYLPVEFTYEMYGQSDRKIYANPENAVWLTTEVEVTGGQKYYASFIVRATSNVDVDRPTPTEASYATYAYLDANGQGTSKNLVFRNMAYGNDFPGGESTGGNQWPGQIPVASIVKVTLRPGQWQVDDQAYTLTEVSDTFEAWFSHDPGTVLKWNTAAISSPSVNGGASMTRSPIVMKSKETSFLVGKWTSEHVPGVRRLNTAVPATSPQNESITIPNILWDPYQEATPNREIVIQLTSIDSSGNYGAQAIDQSGSPIFLPASYILVNGDGNWSAGKKILPAFDAHGGANVMQVRVLPGANMLSVNQASLETDTTGWTASGNSSIARSTAQFTDGIASLSLTSLASGTMFAQTPAGLSGTVVSASTSYTAVASFRSAVSGRSCRVRLRWYDSGGAQLSDTNGSLVTDTTSGWTVGTVTGTSPSNAALVAIIVEVQSTAAINEVHYVDKIQLVAGASTTWSAGGSYQLVEVQTGAALTYGIPVNVGTSYTISSWVRAATVGRSVRMKIWFYNSGGTFITAANGSNITDSTTAWQQITATLTAPATATLAVGVVSWSNATNIPLDEIHYVDDVTFTPSGGANLLTDGRSDFESDPLWVSASSSAAGIQRIEMRAPIASTGTGGLYPVQATTWELYEKSQTATSLGVVDENGPWRNGEPAAPGNTNFTLKTYNVTRNDFGIPNTDSFVITWMGADVLDDGRVIAWLDTNTVKPAVTDGSTVEYPANAIVESFGSGVYSYSPFVLRARMRPGASPEWNPSIHSGWYYQGGREGYIYAEPITEGAIANLLTPSQAFFEDQTVAGWPSFSNVNTIWAGVGSVRLPGTTGNFITTPDTAALSVTGDIDIRVKLSLDNWNTLNQSIVSKYNPNTLGRSYMIRMNDTTAGRVQFLWAADGNTGLNISSSVSVPFTAGQVGWIRVYIDVNNGAGGRTTYFWTSLDGVTWTALGVPQTTASTTSIFDSATALTLGAEAVTGNNRMTGNIYRVEIHNGLDGAIVGFFDASSVTPSDSRVPTTTTQGGALYTLNGTQWSWVTAQNGTGSMVLHTTAAATVEATTTRGTSAIPVTVGKTYTATASYRAGSTGRSVTTYIWWLNAAGAMFSSVAGNTLTDVTTGWVTSTSTAMAPVGAVYAVLAVRVAAPVIGETHYVDNASLYESTTTAVLSGLNRQGAPILVRTNEATPKEIRQVAFFDEQASPVTPRLQNEQMLAGNGTNTLYLAYDNVYNAAVTDTASGKLLEGGIRIPGVSTAYVSTPDSAALSIVGDIDIKVKLSMDDWSPSGNQMFVAKLNGTGQYSYAFRAVATGAINFLWTADGTTVLNFTSTVPGFVDGTIHWLRVTVDVNNGASGRTCRMYKSDDGIVWTQFYNNTTAGVTSLFDSTAQVTLGGRQDQADALLGTIYYAEIRNGIDGPVAAYFDGESVNVRGSQDPISLTQGPTTWTLNGTAAWRTRSTTSNALVLSSVTDPDRQYKVTYTLVNSFAADQEYVASDGTFRTRLLFDKTPLQMGVYGYNVTYEGSRYDPATPVDLPLNPLYSSINEGFVFLSHNEYTLDKVEVTVSPSKVLADGNDYLVISLKSLDRYGNPKPNQTFTLGTTFGTLSQTSVTTDRDGFATATMTSGTDTSVSTGLLTVSGVVSATPSFEVEPAPTAGFRLLAVPAAEQIPANGQQQNSVSGRVEDSRFRGYPYAIIRWKRARSLYELFSLPAMADATPSNIITRTFEAEATPISLPADTPPEEGTEEPGISYVGKRSTVTDNGSNSLTISIPPDIRSGDLLLANLHTDYCNISHTPPTGWVLVSWREESAGSNPDSNNPPLTGGKDLCGYVFYKIATGSETSVTFAVTPLTDSHRMQGGVVTAWRGVNTSAPIYDYGVNGQTSGLQVDAPSLNGLAGGVLVCAFHTDDPMTFTAVSGMATVDNFKMPEPPPYDDALLVTYKLLTADGTTGIKSAPFTGSGGMNDMGWSVSLKPLIPGVASNREVVSVTKSSTYAPGTVLVPARGCMLGWYPGSNNWAQFQTDQTEVGKNFAIIRYFGDWEVPGSNATTMINNRLVLISHKPPGAGSWRKIADGTYNKFLDDLGDYYKARNKEVVVILHHEPHDDATNLGKSGEFGTDEEYRAAWRTFVTRIKARGANKVKFGYCAVGSWATKTPDKLYPGNDLVDVLCHDVYNWGDYKGGWDEFADDWSKQVSLAKRLDKPIIGGEVGVHPSGGGHSRGQWFRNAAAYIKGNADASKYIIGFCYYHVDSHGGSGHMWRFLSNANTFDDGKQGYIDAFKNDTYFKATAFPINPGLAPPQSVPDPTYNLPGNETGPILYDPPPAQEEETTTSVGPQQATPTQAVVFTNTTTTTTPGPQTFAGSVVADINGYFTIGPFTSAPPNQPGYWFLSAEMDGLAYDSFDRPNGPIVEVNTGTDWENVTSTFTISNEAAIPSATTAMSVVQTGNANVSVEVVLHDVAVSGTATLGPVLRYTDSSNFIYATHTNRTQFRIVRVQAGVHTLISAAVNTDPPIPSASPYTVRLEGEGSSIRLYVNGGLLTSATSSFNQNATKHGMRNQGGDATAKVTNFLVNAIGVDDGAVGDVAFWYEHPDLLYGPHPTTGLPRLSVQEATPPSSYPKYSTGNAFPSYYDEATPYAPATPITATWLPPKWYALPKYQQYQLGLLGNVRGHVTYGTNVHEFRKVI